jgi:putative transposase
MSDQFWLAKAQLKRNERFFPQTRGIPRVDGSPCDPEWSAMAGCGLWPHKTLHNRFVRWSRMGIFDRIFANFAAESGPPDRVMIVLRRIGRPPVCSKAGFIPSHRLHERQAKLQAARGLRWRWPASYLSSHRRTNA